MLRENENVSDNFGPHKDEESALKRQNIEGNNIDLVNKSSDAESYARNILSRRSP